MLSIVIPAYNEGSTVSKTVESVHHVMRESAYDYEVIVVDDGSTDNTFESLQNVKATVIRHSHNLGYGSALKTGIGRAKHEWIAIIDADGSYPTEQLIELMAYVPDFDMVVGTRTGKHYWGSLGKRIGRYFLTWMVKFVVGVHVPDVNSGLRIFRHDLAVKHLPRLSTGFSFTTSITLAFLSEHDFVKYVPIEYRPRIGASKVNVFRDSLRTTQLLAQAVIYYNPLKLFLLLSFASVGVGVIVALGYFLFLHFALGFFFLAGSVLVAILIGALGFLVEAMRLYDIS